MGFDEVDAGLTGCMGSASLETELKKKIIYTFGLFPNSFLCRFLPFICPSHLQHGPESPDISDLFTYKKIKDTYVKKAQNNYCLHLQLHLAKNETGSRNL